MTAGIDCVDVIVRAADIILDGGNTPSRTCTRDTSFTDGLQGSLYEWGENKLRDEKGYVLSFLAQCRLVTPGFPTTAHVRAACLRPMEASSQRGHWRRKVEGFLDRIDIPSPVIWQGGVV